VTAVNDVRLEDYLRGVVPGEMPASWHRAALRAQAVVARSYALATARHDGLFDQYPDTRSQVYKGVAGEQPESDAAVGATAGRVLLHAGSVATTFFHSTSGGRTESAANVFGRAEPYLVSVADPEDRISPHHRWSVSLTGEEIERRLGSLVDGRYRGVDVLRRGDSPRILRAAVVGTDGRRSATGDQLKARLGLRDTWARFGRIDTAPAPAATAMRSPSTGAAPAGVLSGRVTPAPRGGTVVIERRGERGWRVAERARTARSGAFRVSVARPGRYRVRADGVPGPAVRIADRTQRRVCG
jgi:stage II sporulation protein D